MDKIIGLGGAGCSIAEGFCQYTQYDVYKLDTSPTGGGIHYGLQKYGTPEDYERNTPVLTDFFKDVDGDILFIVGGGGKTSGAALKVLQQLKGCNINVLYIKPDTASLSNTAYLQYRLTFNVLQEYARCGLLNKIFLVDNKQLESIVGDVPLLQIRGKMNDIVVNAIHYYNIFTHTDAVYENSEQLSETSRIGTFGIYDMTNSTETPFFQLDSLRDKCYYYCINEDVINSDGKLLKTIKEQVSKENIKASYQIHSTKHPSSFCYTAGYTNQIQST
jgi:hypothetical protein